MNIKVKDPKLACESCGYRAHPDGGWCWLMLEAPRQLCTMHLPKQSAEWQPIVTVKERRQETWNGVVERFFAGLPALEDERPA